MVEAVLPQSLCRGLTVFEKSNLLGELVKRHRKILGLTEDNLNREGCMRIIEGFKTTVGMNEMRNAASSRNASGYL
jgi:hypothetical protein